MACLRSFGTGDCVIRKHGGGYHDEVSGRVSGFTKLRSLSIPNLAGKLHSRGISTAVQATVACDSGLTLQTEKTGYVLDNEFSDRTSIESPRVTEKLDEWIQNSVTEIVKNIKQAPLLVQIYADGEVKTKKAPAAKEWENVAKQRSSSLEGFILVEELRENTDALFSGDKSEDEDGTRAFGVLIQGKVKGRDQCKSTCYLLKTSSVNGEGLGHICTHFCLMKVQSFHKNAFSQFNDCWLLQ